jgi:GTP-binding protein
LGSKTFNIGDTISDAETQEALPIISVDEPTMNMLFSVNNSPFFGKDGKYVTSRHLHDRLMKETEKNLALKVEKSEDGDSLNGIWSRYPSFGYIDRDHAQGRI